MKLTSMVITCGGTAGHFYPGLVIARVFQQNGGRVLLLLSGVNSSKQCQIAESYGIAAKVLPKMPSPKHFIRFAFGLIGGLLGSLYQLAKFRPQAVLGMGSFASFPTILAARFWRIPYFLHDGNARIGKANRFFSKRAIFLAAAFPPVNANCLTAKRTMVTGMPVRPELEAAVGITKAMAIARLNQTFETDLKPDLPTILIFGGSQGASVINKIAPGALLSLNSAKFQVLHLAGPGKLDEARAAYQGATFPLLLLSSSEKMELFLGAADLVLSRSGGSTIAELSLFGKSAILIPYPYAAEDHQTDNARYLADADAALLVQNKDFTIEYAKELFQDFLDDPLKWQQRAKRALTLSKPHAAETLLSAISDYFESFTN